MKDFMDFCEVINKRKSVRSFDTEKEVTSDQIEKIIQAGKRAPSAGGLYPVKFLVVKEKEVREKLSGAAFGQGFIVQAPVVIVVVVDFEKVAKVYGKRGQKLYAIQDGAVAAQNMLLTVTALGLGSCWVGAFDEKEVKEILNLSDNKRPQVILPIGYKK